jgi:ketosteroid isomerase-like protein
MVNADVVRETATRFQHAIEALDTPAAAILMREDVQLYSPIPRAPFEGRDVVASVFDFLATVASAPHFVSVAHGENEAILCFDGALAGRDCEWIHRVQIDEDGKIWRITDMVRPLSAVLALQTAAGGRTA